MAQEPAGDLEQRLTGFHQSATPRILESLPQSVLVLMVGVVEAGRLLRQLLLFQHLWCALLRKLGHAGGVGLPERRTSDGRLVWIGDELGRRIWLGYGRSRRAGWLVRRVVWWNAKLGREYFDGCRLPRLVLRHTLVRRLGWRLLWNIVHHARRILGELLLRLSLCIWRIVGWILHRAGRKGRRPVLRLFRIAIVSVARNDSTPPPRRRGGRIARPEGEWLSVAVGCPDAGLLLRRVLAKAASCVSGLIMLSSLLFVSFHHTRSVVLGSSQRRIEE